MTGEPGAPEVAPEETLEGAPVPVPLPVPTEEEAADLLALVEEQLLGQAPHLTRVQVAERAGTPLTVASELWRLLGFAQLGDEEVAFTDGDVEALQHARALYDAGVIDAESQAALVRTWGRSFARLAEWQVDLLTSVVAEAAAAGEDPAERLTEVATGLLPRIEALQSLAWRRHLAAAAGRVLSDGRTEAAGAGGTAAPMTVAFVDIVGYTTRSKELDQAGLVAWLEGFEDRASSVVHEHGGRIVKTIGDEVLFVADTPRQAAAAAWELTRLGADEDDPFPAVRAGLAHGDVVARLGDVYGPTVNVAARLTSHARPGSVLVDRGVHDVLCPDHGPPGPDGEPPGPWRLKRLARTSVKGYARLESWVLREPRG